MAEWVITMKITGCRVTKMAIPLRETLRMGIDREMLETQSCVIELFTDDESIVGVAESPFDPQRTEFEMARLKGRFIGMDPFDIERLVGGDAMIGELYKTVSAVEIACYDIMGKKLGLPAYKLLGGRVWDKIDVTAFMSYDDDPEVVAQKCVEAVNKGYSTLKLKLGLDRNIDVEIVRQVRKAVGPKPIIRIDPNQGWSYPTALSILKQIEDCDIQYVEQPIAKWDHDGMKKLAQRTGVPICICEGLTSFPELMRLIKNDAVDFISSDPIRTGGLLGFKKLCGIAEAEGIPVVAHVSTYGVSAAVFTHAVISNHATMFAHDICYPGLDVGAWAPVDDICTGGIRVLDGGSIDVTDEPGFGVKLNHEKMEKWADYLENVVNPRNNAEFLAHRYGKPRQETTYFLPPRF